MKKLCVKEECIGCGACVAIASNLFKFDDEGHSTAIKEKLDDKEISEAEEAAGACPVAAIEIKNIDNSNETK